MVLGLKFQRQDIEVLSAVQIPGSLGMRFVATPVAPVGSRYLAGGSHVVGVKGIDSFAGADEVQVPHGPSEQKLEPLLSHQEEWEDLVPEELSDQEQFLSGDTGAGVGVESQEVTPQGADAQQGAGAQQQGAGLRQAGGTAGDQGVVPQGPSGVVAVGYVIAQQAGQNHGERDEKWAIIPEIGDDTGKSGICGKANQHEISLPEVSNQDRVRSSSDMRMTAAIEELSTNQKGLLGDKAEPLSNYGFMAEISVSRDPGIDHMSPGAIEGVEGRPKEYGVATRRSKDHRRARRRRRHIRRLRRMRHHGDGQPRMRNHGRMDYMGGAAKQNRRAGSVPFKKPMRTRSSMRRATGDSRRNRGDVDLRSFDGNANFVPLFRSKMTNKRWRAKPSVMVSKEFAQEIGRVSANEPGGAILVPAVRESLS